MDPSINAALIASSHAAGYVGDFEGFRSIAYQDGAGVWTIGFGHTGPEVHQGLGWTRDQAIAALTHDLLTADHAVVREIVTPLNQNQFDALVSFTFNLGEGTLRKSSILTNIAAGHWQAAGDTFLAYDKIRKDGQLVVSPGLHNRRVAERELFLKPL